MKKFTLLLIGIGMAGIGYSADNLTEKIKFANMEKASALLVQEDAFTESWSQFDIDSRMHKKNSSKEELFAFIAKQARDWSAKEKDKILSIASSIDQEIEKKEYQINFPEEIYFVKTTAKEEGGAGGYTRGNYIVLKENILSSPKSQLKKTIIHELFHVLTRNNADFRKEMYEIIGFEMMNEIDYPNHLQAYRITNPDAPQTDSYITLKVAGKPVDLMMMLYATRDYAGGEFFKYLNVGFLELEGESEKRVKYQNGKPSIYSMREVEDFFEHVGKNTQYIIHPEEIMADNFSYALLNKKGLANPEIVNEIKAKLKE